MDNTELAWRKIQHLVGKCNKTGFTAVQT